MTSSTSKGLKYFLIPVALLLFAIACNAQPAGKCFAWSSWYFTAAPVPTAATNVVAVTAGNSHLVALRNDGQVVSWTGNLPGHVSGGPIDVPAGLSNVIAIAAASDHSTALKSDGTLVGWGSIYDGYDWVPNAAPTGLSNIVAISAGFDCLVALRQDGTAVAWGAKGTVGQEPPTGLSNVVAVLSIQPYGGPRVNNKFALQGDGTIVSWGWEGAQSVRLTSGNVKPIALSGMRQCLVLESDGSVVDLNNQRINGWTNVATCSALGMVNRDGRLNTPPTSNVFAVCSGQYYSAGIVGDGKPYITVQPAGYTAIADDDVSLHVMVVSSVPVNYQWQYNGCDVLNATNSSFLIPKVCSTNAGDYRVTVSSSLGNLTSATATLKVDRLPYIIKQPANLAVDLGTTATFFVQAKGLHPLSFQWLKNGFPISDDTKFSGSTSSLLAIAEASDADVGTYSVILSNAAGSVTSLSATLTVITPPKSFSMPPTGRVINYAGPMPMNMDAIGFAASSDYYNLFLLPNRTVSAWNNNLPNCSSCVHGGSDVPAGLTDVVSISAGRWSSLALRANGTVVGWGALVYTPYEAVPNSPPSGLTNVIAIAAGVSHCMALKKDGTIVMWGQQTAPTGISNVVAIAACGTSSCVLTADGKVQAWGPNFAPATNNLSDIIAISGSGTNSFCALQADGTMVDYDGTVLATDVAAIAGGVMGIHNNGTAFKLEGGVESTLTNNAIAVASTIRYSVPYYETPAAHPRLVLVGNGQPAIGVQPYTQNSIAGQSVTFRTKVVSSSAVTYQWQFNGVDISDATGSSYTVPESSDSNSGGIYQVIVRNSVGSVTSDGATLTQPFPVGSYNGLFYEETTVATKIATKAVRTLSTAHGVRHATSGFLTFKTTAKRAVSGKATIAGIKYPLTGRFTGRHADITVIRANQTPISLSIDLQTQKRSDYAAGKVSDGLWVSKLISDKTEFNKKSPSPFQGVYTMLLPSKSDGQLSPGGDSLGAVTVRPDGTIHLAGSLSDNASVSQSVAISKDGRWPIYVSLYGGNGTLIGWINFSNRVDSSLEGFVSWIKASAWGTNYSSGFTNESYAIGSTYALPLDGTPLNVVDGIAVLSGANLDKPIVQDFDAAQRKLIFTDASGVIRSITVQANTGVFKGRLLNAEDGTALPVKGIVIQQQNSCGGFFNQADKSGSFFLQEKN